MYGSRFLQASVEESDTQTEKLGYHKTVETASYCSDFFFFLLFFFSAFFSPSVESATTDAWLGLKEIALEDEVAAKSKIEPVSTAKRMRLMRFSKYFVFVKGKWIYC